MSVDDFSRFEKNGIYIIGTSLVEHVLTSCCKKIEEKKQYDLIEYFLGYLDRYSDIFKDNIWLKYHKGKLLLMNGKYQEAREYIIPVVREKQSESWAWSLLGLSFKDEDIDKSISCFVRGITECKEENFIINIRLELAKVLLSKSMYEEAKYELQKIFDFKRSSGQKIAIEVSNLFQEDWFIGTKLLENNSKLYNDFLGISNNIILDSLPWENALVDHVDDKSNKLYILLQNQECVTIKRDQIKTKFHISPGSPISVKFGTETGRIHIYDIAPRNAEKWDILPLHIGIIDNVNKEKSLSHIVFSKNADCIMHYDKFPDLISLQIGSFVECKLKRMEKNRIAKYILLTCDKSNKKPDNSIYREIEGRFIDPNYNDDNADFFCDYSPNNGVGVKDESNNKCTTFGFVESDTLFNNVYVDKNTVTENNLYNGDKVACKIIFNKKKNGKDGWKAISLSKITES